MPANSTTEHLGIAVALCRSLGSSILALHTRQAKADCGRETAKAIPGILESSASASALTLHIRRVVLRRCTQVHRAVNNLFLQTTANNH